MIYDCFPYFNEDGILELRLNELAGVVDKFIIIEADKTFNGDTKPQNFNYNKFSKFKDKIIYRYITDYPELTNSWVLEGYQRDYISEVLKDIKCDNDDIIIVSDVDEIPSTEAVLQYKLGNNGIYKLQQKMYNYFYNLLNKYETPWGKAFIMRYKNFLQANQSLTSIRLNMGRPMLPNAGWHFTYVNTPEMISYKLKSFAHQEFNSDKYTNVDHIREFLVNKQEILYRGYQLEQVELDSSFPKYLLDNKEKYKQFILD